ncbi:MAG TPA: LON peptidase substrate-binding domain-containing protein [Casimicrobiaceae bacterium]|nr:LON peptidase substrate-binding domain-containing protein [Casimicrobiaceae bacterium]
MFGFTSGAASREAAALPLFPLKTVLFPGGLLPLKVFEQRYVTMTKACLKDETPFGVCLLTQGEEVAHAATGPLSFASVGTRARIVAWDMPQLGILHIRTQGLARFQVRSHAVAADGLVVGQVTDIPPEPTTALPEEFTPLAKLLAVLIERVGKENFPSDLLLDDASWVGYRLAEILPLPLSIKQSMLEINDSEVRLTTLKRFLKQQELL